MPDYSVIADVSETLRLTLHDALQTLGMPPHPTAEVHDLNGQISTNPARLTLFLYEVVEDPSQRNRPPLQDIQPPSLTLQKPPMALLLRYMMTPWSGDRPTDHQILGRTMQTLYDGAILSGPSLQGGLAGSSQALKLTLAPLQLDERSRIWHAIQRPYRLSVCYEVRVVNLDATSIETRPPIGARRLNSSGPQAAA
jgi:hypothetical protein